MKKYLLLMLLTPFAYADVVMLSSTIDDNETTEYQILCVFSHVIFKGEAIKNDTGYQYLKTSRVFIQDKIIGADKVYLDPDQAPVITQMFQFAVMGNKDWQSVPIRCSRPE